MYFFSLLFGGLFFLFPTNAWAYLDPGTGNALIYILVTIVSSLLFFFKNICYGIRLRLSGNAPQKIQVPENTNLVIFSEGKIYWPVFKPIVEALLQRQYPFRYLTMDIHDPALTIENPCMHSKYIGSGSAAFARAASTRALVMLQTTPHIGTPGYPMPMPTHVRCLAHVLHGVGGVGAYYKNAHDTCHTLLLMGDSDFGSIRVLEAKRGLAPRECVAAGVPSLDELAKTIVPREGCSNPPVILVAPSWGERNCIGYCGIAFIQWLLESGYYVILRPHPFSSKAEPELIQHLETLFRANPNLQFDHNVSSSQSLAMADLMISDTSGVRFDFAFLYNKPVVTLQKPFENMNQYEFGDLDYIWEEDITQKLGPIFSLDANNTLEKDIFLQKVAEALRTDPTDLRGLRDESIANFGCSGAFIADWAIRKCAMLAEVEAL